MENLPGLIPTVFNWFKNLLKGEESKIADDISGGTQNNTLKAHSTGAGNAFNGDNNKVQPLTVIAHTGSVVNVVTDGVPTLPTTTYSDYPNKTNKSDHFKTMLFVLIEKQVLVSEQLDEWYRDLNLGYSALQQNDTQQATTYFLRPYKQILNLMVTVIPHLDFTIEDESEKLRILPESSESAQKNVEQVMLNLLKLVQYWYKNR